MKPKLIVIEGPDSTGKSTQVKLLQSIYNAKQIRQPSGESVVGFLRDIVKNDPEVLPFSRQLLHTVSHVVDAFTEFDGKSNIIMDRCHASACVYGEITGLSKKENEIILNIHKKVYEHVLENYDISIIFIDREERIKQELTDKFEQSFNWYDLRDKYRAFFETLSDTNYLFSNHENVYRLKTDCFSKEDITNLLVQLIEL